MCMVWATMAQFNSSVCRNWITSCDGLDFLTRLGLFTVWRVDDLGLLNNVMMALNLRIAFLKYISKTKILRIKIINKRKSIKKIECVLSQDHLSPKIYSFNKWYISFPIIPLEKSCTELKIFIWSGGCDNPNTYLSWSGNCMFWLS